MDRADTAPAETRVRESLTPETLLPDELLETFRARAGGYDRENRFFDEDFADLVRIGYPLMLVPREFGGLGFTLRQAAAAQRRLAAAAPATALGINMHHVLVGVGHTLRLRGDERARGIFEQAAAGEIFAFGISEAGNDAVLFDAATTAEATADGYRVTGTKIFTSLSPVWTRLIVHARDDADPRAPLVFGFVARDDEGVEILDDWDTLGMRASQSRSTILHAVRLPADQVLTRTPAGPNPDPVVWGIFGCFELLLAAVYTGIADRAVQLAAELAGARRSRARGTSYAQDPDIRWQIAEAALLRDGVELQLDRLTADVDALGSAGAPDHGPRWFLLFSGVKHRATETARQVVDLAMRTSGGAQYSRGGELERLYRDVLAGIYHPSDSESVHAAVAKALLGPLEA
ncbi:acyl-CoA dehydrogenase family protein [Kocuria turfanensis]|uniref:Acyl-CoA dehydrogenase n=1 Tax=Kocuria turfanensis TaxID=388357 RepID=A0A512IFY9_9MICC|nr:acyl-CoA dehydrogenase family protein [Kocuria turfanensis]GEO96624.1 acyl-CoA dehydrogenase [Kocuria turfanensis]